MSGPICSFRGCAHDDPVIEGLIVTVQYEDETSTLVLFMHPDCAKKHQEATRIAFLHRACRANADLN